MPCGILLVMLCGGTASYIECTYCIVILMTHSRYTHVSTEP